VAVYESPITEFIGLMCHAAREDHRVDALPLGAVEKMLVLAVDALHLRIPFLETTVTPRGRMVVCCREAVVADLARDHVRNLKSRYFAVVTDPKPLVCPRPQTAERLEEIVGKSYYAQYDGAARCLVELWKAIGVQGLMLLSILQAGDGGIGLLVADIEFALDAIKGWRERRYCREEALRRLENALDAFRDKRKMIERAREVFAKALMECRNLQAKAMVRRCSPELPAEEFLKLLGELHDLTRKVGHGMIKRQNANAIVSESLMRIRSWSRIGVGDASSTDHGVEPDAGFHDAVYRWLWALAGERRPDELAGRTLAVSGGERPAIAAADIRRFTETMTRLQDEHHTIGKAEIHQWFTRIRTIPKNWWVLLGGALSGTSLEEGDSFFGCFADVRSAVVSSALAVYHLNLRDAALPRDGRLRFGLRIAVGRGTSAVVMDGVDISAAANKMFHLLKSLGGEHAGAATLMLDPTAAATDPGLLEYQVSGGPEQGWVLDHAAIVRDCVGRICAPSGTI
jgi:hypothetical protein